LHVSWTPVWRLVNDVMLQLIPDVVCNCNDLDFAWSEPEVRSERIGVNVFGAQGSDAVPSAISGFIHVVFPKFVGLRHKEELFNNSASRLDVARPVQQYANTRQILN